MSQRACNHPLGIPVKRYRIGELVRHSPFSRQTIHNYTIMGLIREAEWTQGGHRLYDESVFDRLSRILTLRETMSLTEIRRVLHEEDRTTVMSPSPDGLASAAAEPSPRSRQSREQGEVGTSQRSISADQAR